jgi:ATP-dependent DNA helicase RecQ
MNLEAILHKTFGHSSFRANQEAVCRAATSGRDVLLVMPTGAGKSLCYQLPAIARAGTALVISPLIALMDDQAAKLTALGLNVARIHSGLSREESRQACRDYLDGSLNFLFIAPERLRVPGFPQMLSRRKPALIAIDEAHCISAWGHDFRPDYRTLGDYLPSLRPAPIIALTATATPTVQHDIVAQLQLEDPALFIHGFRRHNLSIEVIELSKPRRDEFTTNLLLKSENRPAIVYAPSRKSAEDLSQRLATAIGNTKAAPYHAGLDPTTRSRIQESFLSGKLEVVVATVAFGMGIDKPDVRTVVHAALPGSVEQYYQEIGRAGRDGLPARTVLLHSFADRKMHDFFLERDYPAASELVRVAALLTPEYQEPAAIWKRLRLDEETFNRAVEKLASQGAAAIDFDGNVRATDQTHSSKAWRSGYDLQLAFRRSQIDLMAAYAESPQCRMAALIQHFGDTTDGLRPCGNCDFCSPERAEAQPFRTPTPQEDRQLRAILSALDSIPSKSTGKLHSDLALGIDRKQFDSYLDALARAGLITLTTDSFTSKDDGREISYKRASLTHEGRNREEGEDLAILLRDTADAPAKSRKGSRSARTNPRAQKKSASESEKEDLTPEQTRLETRLREWRKSEAAKTGKPAFIVFGDGVLHNLVVAAPQTISQLLEVSGIGQDKADRYGADIIAIFRESATGTAASSPAKPRSTQAPRSAPVEAKPISQPRPHEPGPPEPASRSRSPQIVLAEALSPDQQALDSRLREWRKSESEKIGMPQFFVLSASTLRAIVLAQPRTLDHLRTLDGIGYEKLERYGPGILAVCNA